MDVGPRRAIHQRDERERAENGNPHRRRLAPSPRIKAPMGSYRATWRATGAIRLSVRPLGMPKFSSGNGRPDRPGATAALRAGAERARQATAAARARGADGLERALDRVFDEPFDVPDADTAVRLLSGTQAAPMGIVGRYLEGQALVRIAAQVTKLAARSRAAGAAARVAAVPAAINSASGATAGAAATAGGAAMSTATSMGAAALAAAAVAAATRTTRTVRRGLLDVRVLASYLASQARAQHVVLDKAALRALTLATYTDPRRRVDFRFAGTRGATAVLARWSRDTASTPSDARRRDDIDAWIDAIDRLDLAALADEWRPASPSSSSWWSRSSTPWWCSTSTTA